MQEYEKDQEIYERNEKEKEMQLIESIIKTRKELNRAHTNFEFAEEELIDYYTYEIKATQSKLDYLIRLAKSKKIRINRIEQLKFNDEKNQESEEAV